jgi:hypothetical protein
MTMIFALDTNVWIKERLLRTVTGVAFLYAVRRVGGKLLLPDTTRREIITGVGRAGVDAVKNIERGLGIVQQLTGSSPGIVCPSIDAFRQSAETRLNEIGDLVLPVEVLERHLRSALDRVLDHRAPASTSEQFRDSILWECILDMKQNCLFVTEDGDFLDKKAKGTVLSPDLDKEAGGIVQLFNNIEEVLRSIASQLPHHDDEAIAKALAEAVLSEIESTIGDQGWHAGHRISSSVELYATERLNATAAVFTLEFKALGGEDLQGRSVDEGVAQVTGKCMLLDDLYISELALDGIKLYTLEGDLMKGGAVIARGVTFTSGTPDVPYSVRAPVPRMPA